MEPTKGMMELKDRQIEAGIKARTRMAECLGMLQARLEMLKGAHERMLVRQRAALVSLEEIEVALDSEPINAALDEDALNTLRGATHEARREVSINEMQIDELMKLARRTITEVEERMRA